MSDETLREAEARGAERVAQAIEAVRFEATFEHPVEEMLRKGITSEDYEKGYRKALTQAVRIARSEYPDTEPLRDVTRGELVAAVWEDFGIVGDEQAADDLAAHLLAHFHVTPRD